MAEVRETRLPGVGIRHEFTTTAGEHLAVLSHRNGRREIVIYDPEDEDAGRTVLHLSRDDTRTLAEVLGAGQVSEAVAAVQQQIEGLAIDWIRIPETSSLVGGTIGDGRFRTRTGSTIVAIVRGESTLPAPGPEELLQPGDVAVAVGTPAGLEQLRSLVTT